MASSTRRGEITMSERIFSVSPIWWQEPSCANHCLLSPKANVLQCSCWPEELIGWHCFDLDSSPGHRQRQCWFDKKFKLVFCTKSRRGINLLPKWLVCANITGAPMVSLAKRSGVLPRSEERAIPGSCSKCQGNLLQVLLHSSEGSLKYMLFYFIAPRRTQEADTSRRRHRPVSDVMDLLFVQTPALLWKSPVSICWVVQAAA